MEMLCFTGNYRKRYARVKEFCQWKVEVVFEEILKEFCNGWLEEEYTMQAGRERYERQAGADWRGGHYRRRLVTGRGVMELRVPRGAKRRYRYTLFDRYQRKTAGFEDIVVDALIKGHSTRKASRFFGRMFGQQTISHQAATATLRRFEYGLEQWKNRDIRDGGMILVLDAVALKGAMRHHKRAKPVLFAYAIYADGQEEVLDFEVAQGESTDAWTRFCQKLYDRGLKDVRLIVHDDCAAIGSAVSLCWPRALDQQCVFHLLSNFQKKLKGWSDKKQIVKDVCWLYEAVSEEEYYRWLIAFQKRYQRYRNTKAFRYLYSKVYQSIRYFSLPRKYWSIAKTSNRLERFFEELRRRITCLRRFPNTKSCQRWLYALITELKPVTSYGPGSESQQDS